MAGEQLSTQQQLAESKVDETPAAVGLVEGSASTPVSSPGTSAAAELEQAIDYPDTITKPTPQELLAYAIGIVDKRYDLYHWCEQKTYTLTAVDGLLFAVFSFLLRKVPVDTVAIPVLTQMLPYHLRTAATLAEVEALVFLLSSLVLSLWHIIPLMDAHVGNRNNPRTVVGVESYRDKDAYYDALLGLDQSDMIRYTAYQIKGMSRNIWRDQRAILWAVRFSVLSLIGLATMAVMVVFQ